MPPIVIWILVLSCQEEMTMFLLFIFLLLFLSSPYFSSSLTSFLLIPLPVLLNSVWYRGTVLICLQTLPFFLVPIPFCLVKVKSVNENSCCYQNLFHVVEHWNLQRSPWSCFHAAINIGAKSKADKGEFNCHKYYRQVTCWLKFTLTYK